MGMDTQIAGYPKQLAPHLELRRVLGEGGSSIVFEAFHTRLKVPVAVKLLSVRGALAGQARERLLREAELYALLDDPRIPRVFDVDELSNGTPYVVMEFVPGGSLELLLSRGPLSARRAVTIAKEVLLALAYVHSRAVLHRDVKPANVILNESEGRCQVRLVDFGIAKVFLDAPEQGGPLTQQGTLVGTPHYMAPERLLGHDADARADIYAVGVMLYEMLTGHVPFGGPTLGEVIAAVLRDDPTPLHVLCPHVLPGLTRVVVRAMERNPHARYASAQDMLAALTEVENALSGEVSSPRIVPAAARAISSRPPARPLTFPSLEVTREDLYPIRTVSSSLMLPVLLLALCALGIWTAWSERGGQLVGYLKAQYLGEGSAVGAQSVSVQAPSSLALEQPTAAAPNASPEQPLANLFWDAPRRRFAEGEPRNLLLDAPREHARSELAAEAEAEDESAGLAVRAPTPEDVVPAGEAASSEPRAREHIRVREGAEPEGRYYEPVRSVPLQPLLENIDNMLREAAPPPPAAAPAPPPPAAAPAPLPQKPNPLLPDNPYE